MKVLHWTGSINDLPRILTSKSISFPKAQLSKFFHLTGMSADFADLVRLLRNLWSQYISWTHEYIWIFNKVLQVLLYWHKIRKKFDNKVTIRRTIKEWSSDKHMFFSRLFLKYDQYMHRKESNPSFCMVAKLAIYERIYVREFLVAQNF